MSWLGLADPSERRFSLRGIGHDRGDQRRHPSLDGTLLTRGSLVFEARVAPDHKPHVLLGYQQDWPTRRGLTFRAIPGGGVSMVQTKDGAIAHAAVQHATSARPDQLRVTFSWDCARAWSMLSVERPEMRDVTSTFVPDVAPMRLADLRDLIMGQNTPGFATEMVYAALSDDIEPVGPTPSLSPDAVVETPQGVQKAGQLRRGDTVRTYGGDFVPVLYRIDRTVPARGSFAPIRLRAPYFGLRDDVVVAPDQRLVIDGSEVEYLFGHEAVLVPARHLVNGFAAKREPITPTVTYTQLILPGHDAVLVAGTALESLYIGRLRRKKELLDATVLRRLDRNTLPEHGRPVHPELQWYDAIHLARQRVA